jgi:putative addiction module component (TIGR02574 family)
MSAMGNDGFEDSVEYAWATELKRRIDEVESGAVKTIPWEQVDRELQQILDARTHR